MKKSLALASGIALLTAMFAVPAHAGLTQNGGGCNGSKINGSKINGENLNGRQSGQALQGLALDQVTISLPN
jgi:hypothetical protein